ncbi:MAG TPA: cation-transporting P-type ATPase [Geminicoccus sp.]|uniref:cation-transporting P-type ATPase n=1 Tax=Geminicoccus sp. TaxID=2024832 RepID=UPI002BD69C71|nr:cation-transporting P-type ATPase [Geminicoccus sp.]HWL68377.1 cation-transporting P-type ATPase [Geminicoccus sp.]
MATALDAGKRQLAREPAETPWHALAVDDVLKRLDTDWHGLPSDEARRRLERHGPNSLPQAPGRHPVLRFLAQFHSALIYFLLAAAVGAWVLGHHVDAVVILLVVTINAIVGFVQEGKAEEALAAIRQMISPQANVLRDGQRVAVAVAELVPGDIVLLEAGDRVPADLRLLKVHGLLIQEAALTGESVAAEKDGRPAAADAALGDRHGMAFSGTLVVAGRASGLVVATGSGTEIGRISRLISSVQELTTPLLRQINRFGERFTLFVFVGAVLLFTFAILVRGHDWSDSLLAVVAVAVGVVPEGLPAVITITLAVGVRRMAARKAVVRRLPAVETLGATSVICSDKTGTLTRNEMTARRIVTGGHRIQVEGSGYQPEGALEALGVDDDAAALAAAVPLISCALLCNDAELRQDGTGWSVNGDPMEGALVALAMKAGLDPRHARAEWPRLDEIPFDAQHRFMASLHRRPGGGTTLFVKGAPERVLEMSRAELGPDGRPRPVDQAFWAEAIAATARDGERILGFAMAELPDGQEQLAFADLERAPLIFLGIVGFIDPPRDEAMDAIAECRSAGIRVKMITGDHAATAGAIARQLGMSEDPEVVTGAELDRMDEPALDQAAKRATVFARTSPEHKLRIVQALQRQGAVVAMTGDGVNDAPSLKQADVGVAMGHKGTEAAKEAAEMVLLDDNFASIVAAVHEGRTVYDNIRKVISWTLPTNGGEVIAVIAAILFGFVMPMTATQILWINLILTVTLGLVLAFEPSEDGVMARPPRRPDAPLLSPFLLWRVVFVSALFTIAVLAVFFYVLGRGDDVATARTMVVNTLVVLEIFYLFNVRYLHMTSITWKGAMGTPFVLAAVAAVVVAQFAFTYLPFMNRIFDSRPLSFSDGMLTVVIGITMLMVLEAEKALFQRFGIFQTSRN